jgi:intracellular multiplication protein IcmK
MSKHTLSLAVGAVLAAWILPASAAVKILSADGQVPAAGHMVQPIAAPPANSAAQTAAQTPSTAAPGASHPNAAAMQSNVAAATTSAAGLPPLSESQAFHQTMQAAMPLTPAQIAALREAINANRQAEEAPLSPATPRIETINARLGVGAPPSISVQSGFVSTLNVVDAYGRPWPVVRYSVGNPKAFTVAIAGNSAAISDLQPYAQSDLALYLKGEAVPLMIALNPGASGPQGGGVVDYAVRLRVNAAEPGLPTPVGGVEGGADYTNTLLSLVQGVPPAGAKKLHVLGDPARVSAWTWEGPRGPRLLLRAPATVIAPAWIATMQGAAGIQAWVLPNIRVVTLSENGSPMMIRMQRYQWEDRHHG